jgi:uncharacterized membrane protein
MRNSCTCFLTAVLISLTSCEEAAAAQYAITDLGSFGDGLMVAAAISDAGLVVGHFATNSPLGAYEAFRFSNGALTSLAPSNAWSSEATAVSPSGIVVGQFSASPGHVDFLMWDEIHGRIEVGESPFFYPRAINDSGQMVGSAHGNAYLLDPATGIHEIGVGMGSGNSAHGINQFGHVVGVIGTPGIYSHAFIYRNQTIALLDSATDTSIAYDVNSHDTVVGSLNGRAFVWTQIGDMKDIGTLGGNFSLATAINDDGVVVGYSEAIPESWVGAAFVYDQQSGMRRLDSMIDPSSGWQLLYANDINNKGQIVGWGLRNGASRGFLLTPVPEPAAMALALAGLGVLAIFARRCRCL